MMRFFQRLRKRLLPQEDWQEEIESHLAMRQQQTESSKHLTREEALAETRRRFGSPLRAIEGVRDQYWAHWWEDLLQDIKYALRGWRRNPAFLLAVLSTMTLGIGAATAIFSMVDPLLFRPLPYPDGEQLTSIGVTAPIDNHEFIMGNAYLDWRDHQTAFSSMTAMRPAGQCEITLNRTTPVPCTAVEWNFLPTLKMPPALGRNFLPTEDLPNAPLTVILSNAFWQSSFGGQTDALGRVVDVDGRKARIIGVLSKDFAMPQLGDLDILLPAQIDPAVAQAPNATVFLRAFARLKPGVSLSRARSRMMPLFHQSLRYVPAELRPEIKLAVQSLRDRQIQYTKTASWLLLVAVLFLLAIACVNVINLLLARSEARREEFAMRTALGAGRMRLLRQAFSESLLFALLGSGLGIALAFILLQVLKRLAAGGFLGLASVHLDNRVLLFALAASIVCALIFGSVPALHVTRPALLRSWRAVAGSKHWLRHSLIALQIAFSLLLSTGAVLFMSTLINLESEPVGFRPEQLVAAGVTASRSLYATDERLASFHNELERRLKEIPGTIHFAMSDSIPPSGGMHGRPLSNIRIANHAPVAQNGGMVSFRRITPGYFRTMGIKFLAGRDFSQSDRSGSASSVILSKGLANKLFPNENSLGQRLGLEGPGSPWLTVTGVVADVKNNGLDIPAWPEYYRLRMRNALQLGHSVTAIFRTHLQPVQLERWVEQQVASIDPAAPVKIIVMTDKLHDLNDRPRFLAMVMGVFATASLLLAGVGIFGVVSFLVTSRTREMGVRVALGATRRDIVMLVQTAILRWIALGISGGLLAALLTRSLVRGLLFGISAADPASLLVAVAVMIVMAAAASWYPSLRAARVDPAISLRSE